MLSLSITFFERLFFKYWWVVLFCLLCAIFYEQQRKKIDLEYSKLHQQLVKLQNIKLEKLKVQEDLLLKVNSQSDPNFVELLLMKELGVVPEGQTKIFFNNDD